MAAPWKWWTAIAGTLLVVGGSAWLLKVLTSGAEGARFDLSFYSLLVGSTGLGVRLTANRDTTVRSVAAVGSMAAFFLSFSLFSASLDEAAGIFISAVVWLAIGLALLFGSVLELMPNRLRASLIANKSRMLWLMVAVIAVMFVYYYHDPRVADDETTCVEDRLFNVGASSPSCVPPIAGESIVICEIPVGSRYGIKEGYRTYSGDVDTDTCRHPLLGRLVIR